MSSLVYGIVTAKRTAAPAGQSQAASAPGFGTYIDALAALVPAEALAVYAGVVIPYSTQTVSVHGRDMTVISDPSLLEWSCAGLLALSSLLYLVGRQQVPFNLSDVPRLFIPPMAFTAWMLVQNPGVWDIWWPGSSIGERTVIAAFGAIVLGIAASLLGQQADAMPGTLAVTNVSPDEGSVAGGANVTVTGSGLTGATVVKFGDVAAPKLHLVDDTQLTATSPKAATPGPVDVTVTTPAGTSAGAQFTYQAATAPPTVTELSPEIAAAPTVTKVSPEIAAAPTVTEVRPATGPVEGGIPVTLTGSGFNNATDVKFGQAQAQNLAVTSDTELIVTSPQAANPGPVDVTVSTPAGTSIAAHFTYLPPM
jgi:IPT/TIG domain